MIFTRLLGNLFTLTVAIAVALGATGVGYCQLRKQDLVQLLIVDAKKRYWFVGSSDKQVIAKSYDREDLAPAKGNFKQSNDWMEVDNRYLGYDLEGKSKEVLARQRQGESTQWVKMHFRRLEKGGGRFGMRLRVGNGKLKGWWVGLKVIKEKPERGKPALAHLVLVKDKKDAAVFAWEDPDDKGGR